LPGDAETTPLHVASTEPETLAARRAAACWGNTHTPPPSTAPEPLREISKHAANELLAPTQTRLGRPATLQAGRGRVEDEVVAAAEGMDILVVAGDSDRERVGPHSLCHTTRFVINHAPSRVPLIWPQNRARAGNDPAAATLRGASASPLAAQLTPCRPVRGSGGRADGLNDGCVRAGDAGCSLARAVSWSLEDLR
jgi:hypothetical protein